MGEESKNSDLDVVSLDTLVEKFSRSGKMNFMEMNFKEEVKTGHKNRDAVTQFLVLLLLISENRGGNVSSSTCATLAFLTAPP